MTSRTLPGRLLMMNTRLTLVAMTAALLATILGCGHPTNPTAPDRLPPAPPAPPSPVPTTNTVPAATNGEVGVYRSDATMSRSGTATVTLRWPDGDFSLQLYVTDSACADVTALVTGACTVVGRTRPGSLPGVVRGPVTDGDLRTIWVLNTDPFPQGFSVEVYVD